MLCFVVDLIFRSVVSLGCMSDFPRSSPIRSLFILCPRVYVSGTVVYICHDLVYSPPRAMSVIGSSQRARFCLGESSWWAKCVSFAFFPPWDVPKSGAWILHFCSCLLRLLVIVAPRVTLRHCLVITCQDFILFLSAHSLLKLLKKNCWRNCLSSLFNIIDWWVHLRLILPHTKVNYLLGNDENRIDVY